MPPHPCAQHHRVRTRQWAPLRRRAVSAARGLLQDGMIQATRSGSDQDGCLRPAVEPARRVVAGVAARPTRAPRTPEFQCLSCRDCSATPTCKRRFATHTWRTRTSRTLQSELARQWLGSCQIYRLAPPPVRGGASFWMQGGQVLGQILREGELEGLSHLDAAEVEGHESPVRAAGDPAGRDLAVHVCAAHCTSSAFGGLSSARPSLSPDRLSAACRSGFLARASSRAAFFAAFAISLWRRSKL